MSETSSGITPESLEGLSSPEQSAVLAILYARIGAALDYQDETIPKEWQKTVGETWATSDAYLRAFVEKDPERGFEFGVHLSLLPHHKEEKVERVY